MENNTQSQEEVWKDIEGYEKRYQISNFGRVKSLDRMVNNGNGVRSIEGRILKCGDNQGYRLVLLKKPNSKIMGYSVHRLVAMTFLPNPENKGDVNHKNFNRSDNRVENLEWATRKENIQHLYKFRKPKAYNRIGSKNPNSLFTSEQVLEIRKLDKNGIKRTKLAEMFNCCVGTIDKIRYRKYYADI